MRLAMVVWIVLAVSNETAHARGVVLINSGEGDILHVRDLDETEAKLLSVSNNWSLGYRYQSFGLFFFDIWRGNGEFVLYKQDNYIPLSVEVQAQLSDASVPWAYFLPPGLLIILSLIEFLIVHLVRPRRRVLLVLAGVLVIGSVVVAFQGMPVQCATLALLAVSHIGKEESYDDGP